MNKPENVFTLAARCDPGSRHCVTHLGRERGMLPLVTVAIWAILFAATASSCLSQTRHTAEQRYQMFQQYLVKRAADVTRNNLADIQDLETWKRRRPEILKRYLYVLGLDPMPKKTPLNARFMGALERTGYRVEKIVFESMPGLYVTGNLYLPGQRSGKVPAVVYVCGHAPGPWGAKVQYQHHGIWLARHGYAAFVIDTLEFAEVPGLHHGTHDLGMWYWHSLGYTPAGPEVWNAIRALDYLETRPEVDAKHVAITGISGGGAVTWFTAAADQRFEVGASVCGTWTVGRHVELNAVFENCDCIYFVNPFQDDLPTVGALIAPRPFKMLSAKRDPSFPQAGYHEAFQLTRRIYDLYGAGDRVAEYEHDAPHQDILPFRKEAYEWINRWLKKDGTPFDEGKIDMEGAKELTVLSSAPANPLNGYIHKKFIKTAELRPWKTLETWKARRTELLGELKDKVFRGFPKTTAPFDAWKSREGGWTSRYAEASNVEFTTEAGIRVTGQLFVPRSGKSSYPALVYIKGADDVIYSVDYDILLPALTTHVILVVQPRMTDYPGLTNGQIADLRMKSALVGSTIESMQLWDLLRSVDYVSTAAGVKLDGVSIYGRKQMGSLALYAAAFDPRIKRVILDDAPASHWQGPPLLFVLRVTDLPEAAGLMAPREIVSLTPFRDAWSYTSSIYALYGKKNMMRQAGDLGEALKVWEHR
jgi:cephalosporin-C deacetylase-like acetyl esterase